VHDWVPAKAAMKYTTTAGVDADVIYAEKTPSVMVHVDEIIGERWLLIEVYKRAVPCAVYLASFFVKNTFNTA
jgi:hypothetical protein